MNANTTIADEHGGDNAAITATAPATPVATPTRTATYPTTHLLTLPYELRSQVLSTILPPQRIYLCGLALFGVRTCNKRIFSSYLSLSLTCHQLHREARSELFQSCEFAVVALLPRGHLPRNGSCICDEMIKFAKKLHFEMQNCGGRRVDVVLRKAGERWGFEWVGEEEEVHERAGKQVGVVLERVGAGHLSFEVLSRIGEAVEEAVGVVREGEGEGVGSVRKAFYVSSFGAAA
ncbi:hypothetical protein DOTSEDRAFT_38161 [Dothistroma septosporum NZE10]|uniref:F-box domain-containing protein n=1 Tax=Dothistroma septosporum (strain NZE10 / CBS 128990) TaxID=675120 RepID=N1PFW3_DOTSN|nr:hypothetical protein DOTSEDRAFT_38161 [Dothistroma septosporum NZE10]